MFLKNAVLLFEIKVSVVTPRLLSSSLVATLITPEFISATPSLFAMLDVISEYELTCGNIMFAYPFNILLVEDS